MMGFWPIAGLLIATVGAEPVRTVTVQNDGELRRAIGQLAPGTLLRLAPGNYRGGVMVVSAAGTAETPIVIEAADAKRPPVFSGGSEGIHLTDCQHLVLRRLVVKGFPGNGINADDGGSYETPSRHVVFEDLVIAETGPQGNHDALKISGVDEFVVRRCRFEGWGGSAIDMVGCHRGVVEDCQFVGRPGYSQHSGVQIKGGSSEIIVQTSYFENVGQRAINLGGSTGLAYFRPAVGSFEASDVEVAGNRFVGGQAVVAFVNATRGRVHHNTIYRPQRWVLRILQENNDPRMQPCREGTFEHNLVVYDRQLSTTVNVGPTTAPQTFVFRGNAWHAADGASRPTLPTPEQRGIYQVDPQLDRPGTAEMAIRNARLAGVGADAYKRQTNRASGADRKREGRAVIDR